MSNYRIYEKDTQVLWSFVIYPTRIDANIAIDHLETLQPSLKGQLEARPDLDPITVSHGLPEGEKE
jgi:hypothetical protein